MVYTISRDIHMVSGGSPTYNIPFAFRISIHQQTDVEQSPFQQLLRAVLNLVKRHEALRTVLLGPPAGLDGFSLKTRKNLEIPWFIISVHIENCLGHSHLGRNALEGEMEASESCRLSQRILDIEDMDLPESMPLRKTFL